ncbi:hypothetical protein [Ruminococcus albus]|uniref:Uncharacterized protein n=1 Tax=Ruminococcus albus (strain ATCC 27210 / DSM 20455 / JCM 14654 / NCDO 2250 / 7) TaxID=697329 RepID=E6UCZ6_RUMA7|nr:hypothetical protein [Ruminococcus albus]ADU20790.1 hypothetical protein Rumal_0233 [Ruminococcus albus 7 = DSM 20455]
MYIDNNYFEEKQTTIDSIEHYFTRYPIDKANIARMYSEEVLGVADTEQLIIAEIIFYHAMWKKAGGLPTYAIDRIKSLTNKIIQSNQSFNYLNGDEYNDFIKMVKELNESEIDLLGDNS